MSTGHNDQLSQAVILPHGVFLGQVPGSELVSDTSGSLSDALSPPGSYTPSSYCVYTRAFNHVVVYIAAP